MNENISSIISELNALTTKLRTMQGPYVNNMFSDLNNRSLPLKKEDLAIVAEELANMLTGIDEKLIGSDLEEKIKDIPSKIQMFSQNTLPHIFNNNYSPSAVSSYFILMQWIKLLFKPLSNDWERVGKDMLPKSLSRKLRDVSTGLDDVVADKSVLEKRLKSIEGAANVIDTISEQLETLDNIKADVIEIKTEAEEKAANINKSEEEILQIMQRLRESSDEANQIIKNANEAYKLATTTGLAGAFDSRKNSLKTSMGLWICGLLLALGVGSWIGSQRFSAVQQAFKDNVNPSYIWILIFLSVLSLGAPIWFAWIATKQVGQRFKLSEDYAFKSTIAKAYEGYRQEAVKLDPEMELKLFNSALTRFDEAPLRLMDKENHGSPWQEFFSNPAIREAMSKRPTEVMEVLKNLASKNKESKAE